MALTLLTLSCFIFYATSKYFPSEGILWWKQNKMKSLILASAISLFSLYLFTYSYAFSTALILWSVAFMTLLSAIILSVKMHAKWTWAWGSLCILFLIIDLT